MTNRGFRTLQEELPVASSDDIIMVLFPSSISSQYARRPSGNLPSPADDVVMCTPPPGQYTEPPRGSPDTESGQLVITSPLQDLEGGPVSCVMRQSEGTTKTSIHPREQTTHGEVVEACWKVVFGSLMMITVILLHRCRAEHLVQVAVNSLRSRSGNNPSGEMDVACM